MKTFLMFKNHHGRDLPLPNYKAKTFRDRRVEISKTPKRESGSSAVRSNRHSGEVAAYPIKEYLLLFGLIAITLLMLVMLLN